MATNSETDRRVAPRAGRLGTAVVYLNRWDTSEYELGDLSAAGALLRGGPPLRVGRSISVVLKLEGLQPMWIDARVVRRLDFPMAAMAVAFRGLEPTMEDLIHDVVVAALSGRRLRPLPSDSALEWVPGGPVAQAWLG